MEENFDPILEMIYADLKREQEASKGKWRKKVVQSYKQHFGSVDDKLEVALDKVLEGKSPRFKNMDEFQAWIDEDADDAPQEPKEP